MCKELPLEILIKIAHVDLETARKMCCLGAFFTHEYVKMRREYCKHLKAGELFDNMDVRNLEYLYENGYRLNDLDCEHFNVDTHYMYQNSFFRYTEVMIKFFIRTNNALHLFNLLANFNEMVEENLLDNPFRLEFWNEETQEEWEKTLRKKKVLLTKKEFFSFIITTLKKEGYDLDTLTKASGKQMLGLGGDAFQSLYFSYGYRGMRENKNALLKYAVKHDEYEFIKLLHQNGCTTAGISHGNDRIVDIFLTSLGYIDLLKFPEAQMLTQEQYEIYQILGGTFEERKMHRKNHNVVFPAYEYNEKDFPSLKLK